MKILFLGTGAAEGWPGIFCQCKFCQEAKRLGGKNFRLRSSLQLGAKYKVDFPPDSYSQMLKYNLSYANLEHLFITHAHGDHFDPLELRMRKPPFAYLKKKAKLYIYGNELVFQWTKEALNDPDEYGIVFKQVQPFKTFSAGKLEVTPILANHSQDQICLNYIFKIGQKTILQGFDTGWYPEVTWKKLADYRFDLVIMECTNGIEDKSLKPQYHLGIISLIEVQKRMRKMGILSSGHHFLATHFSHNGKLLHQELVERLGDHGIVPAYDGMEVDLG